MCRDHFWPMDKKKKKKTRTKERREEKRQRKISEEGLLGLQWDAKHNKGKGFRDNSASGVSL